MTLSEFLVVLNLLATDRFQLMEELLTLSNLSEVFYQVPGDLLRLLEEMMTLAEIPVVLNL